MKRGLPYLLASTALLFAATACADIDSGNTVVSGFGTLGAVYKGKQKYGLFRNIGHGTPPGRQYSWRDDSLLGLQVAHTFNPEWRVVGQVTLRDQTENTLNNAISRAFVSYRPVGDLTLRFGRMADATFLMSDYCDVGYVYPWVRPPVESYAIIAPKFYDGADATYSIPDASGVWRLKGLAGRMKVAIPEEGNFQYMLESNDLWGLALIREQGPLKVRIGYSSFHLKNPSPLLDKLSPALGLVSGNPLVNAYYPAIAAEAVAMGDEIKRMEGARIGFASAGFSYDDGQWMAQAEISKLSSDTKVFPLASKATSAWAIPSAISCPTSC